MQDIVVPYTLPEVKDHSFFFICQHVSPRYEAKLHRHEAWELYFVTCGRGLRKAGDTVMTFSKGDVVLIPPGMPHCWEYDDESANENGEVEYLMVAFSPRFIEDCMSVFPEVRNRLYGIRFYEEAIRFGAGSSVRIRKSLARMRDCDEAGRLGEMIGLLPFIFTVPDCVFVGKPLKTERSVRRVQQVAAYVMAHYMHRISLDDVARHVGMNRSAFCAFFKRNKGMTFTEFLINYRLETASELLKSTRKQISEICYAVGFNDLPHFVRVFRKKYGVSPSKYRKNEGVD